MTRVVIHNHIPARDNDGLAERIAGAKALYERPGTPGEKAAAEAALRRMGVDPSKFDTPRAEPPKPRYEAPKSKPAEPRKSSYSSTRKMYEVILEYTTTNKYGETKTIHTPPFTTEASDEVTAEAKAREHAKWTWRTVVGGKAPEFKRYSTKRV
jgi:hypothetical protein